MSMNRSACSSSRFHQQDVNYAEREMPKLSPSADERTSIYVHLEVCFPSTQKQTAQHKRKARGLGTNSKNSSARMNDKIIRERGIIINGV
jgi:hypothetical protein